MENEFDENLYDKIEDYLAGRLSDAEKAQLDAAIKADAGLEEQVNLHRLEWEVRERLIRNKRRAQFDASWVENPVQYRKSWWQRYRMLLLTGFVILVAGIGFYLWKPTIPATQPTNNSALPPIDSATIPQQPNRDTTGSKKNDKPLIVASNDDLEKALEKSFKDDLVAYNAQTKGEGMKNNFNENIARYQSVETIDPLYFDKRLILGRAYMHTGEYTKAIAVLQTLTQAKDQTIAHNAEWCLILCMMKRPEQYRNNITKSLKNMTKADHLYQNEALELQKIWSQKQF
jgi:tetratricopeptide (TPR) repeat protein